MEFWIGLLLFGGIMAIVLYRYWDRRQDAKWHAHVPNQLIVSFHDGVTPTQIAEIHKKARCEMMDHDPARSEYPLPLPGMSHREIRLSKLRLWTLVCNWTIPNCSPNSYQATTLSPTPPNRWMETVTVPMWLALRQPQPITALELPESARWHRSCPFAPWTIQEAGN